MHSQLVRNTLQRFSDLTLACRHELSTVCCTERRQKRYALEYRECRWVQVTTVAGWTLIMQRAWDGSNFVAFIYFLTAVIQGTYVLMNLFLAVLKLKFSSASREVLAEVTVVTEVRSPVLRPFCLCCLTRLSFVSICSLCSTAEAEFKNPGRARRCGRCSAHVHAAPTCNVHASCTRCDSHTRRVCQRSGQRRRQPPVSDY